MQDVPVSAPRRLRDLMEAGTVLAPFVWDGAQARYAAAAGHAAVYMTGFGTAASHGLPDIGLLGMAEMQENARRIVAAVDVPVIADADTGYGNPINVANTVRAYEAAGVAALHIEDQVWPKRCGFMDGKEVIPLREMEQKLAAALSARRDPALMVIGRTDALAPLGWDAAIDRAKAYHAVGVDLVFIDGLKTREDIERAAEALPDVPRLLNSELLTAGEAAALGFQLVIQLGSLRALFAAIRGVYEELATTGQIDLAARNAPTIDEIASVLGVEEHRAIEAAVLEGS
ncbi:MAG: isocitrate lyase/PEP mutase family protein [Chloroflexi bacterium]|nr:isocitrate lyase/PEP mutase family protein [Chloroflexota bacterium]MDA1146522.1 isocitrate lyase/PEP mutase family protein [Chloroflexota bacterium]